MSWIHCNKCGQQESGKNVQLYLTNCGHIFCDNCRNSGTSPKCLVCRTLPCNTILLDKKTIKDDVRAYVTDYVEAYQSLCSVYMFQNSHMNLLIRTLKSQLQGGMQKIDELSAGIKATTQRIDQVERETAILKQKLATGTSDAQSDISTRIHGLYHIKRSHGTNSQTQNTGPFSTPRPGVSGPRPAEKFTPLMVSSPIEGLITPRRLTLRRNSPFQRPDNELRSPSICHGGTQTMTA